MREYGAKKPSLKVEGWGSEIGKSYIFRIFQVYAASSTGTSSSEESVISSVSSELFDYTDSVIAEFDSVTSDS